MKKGLFVALMAVSSMMYAQTENNLDYLPLSVAVVDATTETIPDGAKVQITNRLNKLLAQSGVASLDNNSQFVITAFVVPQDKDVLAGPPSQIIETMEATLYIADVSKQLVLATTEQTIKGIGTTETRAYMEAIKNLNVTSDKMKAFVQEGKEKIIAYYDSETPTLIKQALALSEAHEYEQALSLIMVVPTQCKHYDAALQAGLKVFHDYQDYACQQNLAKAKMAWAQQQNKFGADEAGKYLGLIYPDAACYEDAMVLYAEIKAKVLEDWHFQMKQYQDGVDLEKQRIEAARQIGVAYGQNQQPVTTYMGWMR